MARSSREEWLEHAREWKASGLECKEFAKKAGVNGRSLSWWTWKLRSEGERIEAAPRKRRRARVGRGEKTSTVQGPNGIDLVEVGSVTLGGEKVELEVAGVTIRLPEDFTGEALSKVLDVLEARR